jgi:hypothetical protein
VSPLPRPTAAAAVALFRRRFLNRTDVVAFLAPWAKPCPTETGASLDALLLAHVAGTDAPAARVRYRNRLGTGAVMGHFRVGSYCPGAENLAKWLCIDFDGAGHAGALADPTAAARAAQLAFEGAGLPAHLERSGGGKGWHLWCFFEEPLPAKKAQALGHALAPRDAPLATGGVADPSAARGIEVFPKQARVKPGGFGNQVWLPWWHEAPEGANAFYRVDAAGALAAYAPEDFETARLDAVERVLAEHAARAKASAAASAPRPVAEPPPTSDATTASDPVWAAWRAQALAALPLPAVYGAWLTGDAAGAGWLQCRDPASPTGDQNPSAGVADGTGDAERGAFHSHISGKTCSIFDFLVAHGGCGDFRAALARVAELSGVPLPTSSAADDTPARAARPRKPRIVVRTDEHEVVNEAVAALARLPDLYGRSEHLVQVVRVEGKLAGVVYPAGTPRISPLSPPAIRDKLTLAAEWVTMRQSDGGLEEVPAHPPGWAAPAIAARPSRPGIRYLEAVVETPVLRPDGTVLEEPGYDDATGLLHLPDVEYPDAPADPTQEDARAAAAEILDLVCDFPFRTPAHRSAWLAALLTPLARYSFYGPAPLFLMDANVRGAGKSLLADVIGVIVSGRQMPRTAQATDETEEIKRITAIALGGDRMVLLDNIERPLGSGALDTVLTGTLWSERILGKSEKVTLPLLAVWYASGNNVTLKGDTARRCLHVRLDSDHEKPEHRDGFKYPALLRTTQERRGPLVVAALTILRAYCAAGRPTIGAKPWGSFEGWSALMRNAVVWCGLADPGETRADLDEVDTDANVLADLVAGWEELPGEYGTFGCTIAQALEALRDDDPARRFARLRAALGELCPHGHGQLPTARKVGYALRRFRGRVVQGRKLQTRVYAGNNLWYVQRVGAPEPTLAPAAPVAIDDLADLDGASFLP